MAFREVRAFEVREVLRLWLAGEGIRATERLVGFDRKTIRRYVDAAVGLGLVRDGGADQLRDVFVGLVVEAERPSPRRRRARRLPGPPAAFTGSVHRHGRRRQEVRLATVGATGPRTTMGTCRSGRPPQETVEAGS